MKTPSWQLPLLLQQLQRSHRCASCHTSALRAPKMHPCQRLSDDCSCWLDLSPAIPPCMNLPYKSPLQKSQDMREPAL